MVLVDLVPVIASRIKRERRFLGTLYMESGKFIDIKEDNTRQAAKLHFHEVDTI